jgi:hypothetical protein
VGKALEDQKAELEAAKLAKTLLKVNCPACSCHTLEYSLHKANLKRVERGKQKFDLPRDGRGKVAWNDVDAWLPINSGGHDYNNYLRRVTSHFVYHIKVKNSTKHKDLCPAVLRDRAQKALNKVGAAAAPTSRHRFRMLWEVLELKPEEEKNEEDEEE